MSVYFILLLLVLVIAFIRKNDRQNKLRTILLSLCLILVAGLRDVSVGTDSVNYVLIFTKTQSWELIWQGVIEPGFLILAWFSNVLSSNYAVFFLVIASVTILFFVSGIYENSIEPRVSLFLFITSGYYTFFFNGARQGIALSILFFGTKYIFEKKLYKVTLISIFAAFFHSTALILIPAYFLIQRPFSNRVLLYIIIFSFVSSFLIGDLINLAGAFDERFSKYSTYNKASGSLSALYSLVLCLFFIFMYKTIHKNKSMYSILLNMFCIGASISIFAFLNNLGASGIARLSYYFTISSILIWPIIFKNISDFKNKTVLLVSFIAFYLLYFYLTTSYFSNLVPFNFNFNFDAIGMF
jgi:hypothetical protein